MNFKNYSIDTVDFVIITTLIGGYTTHVWWPFWLFIIIHTVAAIEKSKHYEKK